MTRVSHGKSRLAPPVAAARDKPTMMRTIAKVTPRRKWFGWVWVELM